MPENMMNSEHKTNQKAYEGHKATFCNPDKCKKCKDVTCDKIKK